MVDDFKQLDSKGLLILPEQDFFPKESLLNIMTNPDVVWIDAGSHGDPMFNKEYMERVSRFLESNLHQS